LEGGKLGAIVPPNDEKALAKAMIAALSIDHAPLDAAREAAIDRYGIQRSVDCTLSLYQRLLQERV
jgi:hypothetical protein